jgi:integrase
MFSPGRRSAVILASNGLYWQAFYYDLSGRRRGKSLGPKDALSRRAARRACDRLAAQLLLRPRAGQPAPSLGAFLDGYRQSRSDLSQATLYLRTLTGRYLRQHFGADLRIDQITRAAASQWRTALCGGRLEDAKRCRRGRVMNHDSACHRTADARAIFSLAVRDELIPFNPFDRLPSRPRRPDSEWYYLSPDKLDDLLAACPSTGWKLLVALCRLAGLRRGEAISLRWSAVDFQNRRLTILARKTGRRRLVPIVPTLYRMLDDAFTADAESQVPDSQSICRLETASVWRNFTGIRQRAGLPAWKHAFQVLRRNCETDWAQAYPQYAVSAWMGHSIEVSARHYLQVPRELYEKAAGATPSATPNAPTGAEAA